jgi:hypothetical protein
MVALVTTRPYGATKSEIVAVRHSQSPMVAVAYVYIHDDGCDFPVSERRSKV